MGSQKKMSDILYSEERPWGSFEVLFKTSNLQIKRIAVNPGCRLSYQYHNHRSEKWIPISGYGLVDIDDGSRSYSAVIGELDKIPHGS
jgi:mannose-6-phosphate isomerase-like protein (cupin superfamily)